jgi:TrmH family RNA methyltransferase
MLSKSRLKYIKSLQLKKYRKEEQCFVVEGARSVSELFQSDFQITIVAATPLFIEQHRGNLARKGMEVIPVSERELTATGTLQSNDSALAIAKMKPNTPPVFQPGDFALVLDDIRDPGNLGTIIRTADWFGIRHIIASNETADLYNPKTIRATMGSFLRVKLFYTTLTEYLQSAGMIYGAFLKGTNIHELGFANGGFIVIGNESNGISTDLAAMVHERVMIPGYGGAESLNAGVATAIILDNLRRSKK